MIQYQTVLVVIAFCSISSAAPVPEAHTRTEFHFVTEMPFAQAVPLFGAFEEQRWAPEFKPEFIYPTPAADQEGSVFRVKHGSHDSIWVNSVYDLAAGHIQYVYVLGDVLLTRIDIHLSKDGESRTAVSVVYERTALDPSANEHVLKMAAHDGDQGSEWKAALDAYAKR